MNMTDEQRSRFWSKADKSSGCWIWQGYTTEKGYGKVNVNGTAMRAHRVAYELTNGPIGHAMQIDHTCHTRACIKPAHLRETTQKQNQENRQGAARNNPTGIRGVILDRATGRFCAYVAHNHKRHYLGMFPTPEAAEAVVVAKRLELFTHNDSDRKVTQ